MRLLGGILLMVWALLLPCGLHGQNADSAEAVVGRYMQIMNHEALPKDMMLKITTRTVSSDNPSDTGIVMRWFAWPNSYRVEVWYHNTLQEGWHNDEQRVIRRYDETKRRWTIANEMNYFDRVSGYDFRGPLYFRKKNGTEMKYSGTRTFEGHRVLVVSTRVPGMYDRDYLFEAESGLLFLSVEKESFLGDDQPLKDNHVDWRSIDEYLPIGESLVVTKEQYQHQGRRIVATHQPELLPMDRTVFSKD